MSFWDDVFASLLSGDISAPCRICGETYGRSEERDEPSDDEFRPFSLSEKELHWRPTNCPKCDAWSQDRTGFSSIQPEDVLHCMLGKPLRGVLGLRHFPEYTLLRASKDIFDDLQEFDALRFVDLMIANAEANDRLEKLRRFRAQIESGEFAQRIAWLQKRVQAMIAFEREHHLQVRALREAARC
jgi:hypothetical protein